MDMVGSTRHLLSNFTLSFSFTGGFVGEHEAGQRLFQTVHDPRCRKSGVYWSWNGGPREGRGAEAIEKGGQISGGGGAGGGWDSIFENDQSSKVLDVEQQMKLFEYATQITGAEWPEIKQITSPCPTLKVIGAVTKGMVKREELKRMREMGRPGIVEDIPKVGKVKKAVAVVDRGASFVLSNTVGRVARFAGKRILGEFPDEAISGSFDGETVSAAAVEVDPLQAGAELLEDEVTPQLKAEALVDEEDEALFLQIYDDETGSAKATEEKTSVSA